MGRESGNSLTGWIAVELSEPPSSPLTAAQLEQCISRYKTQIMELEKKVPYANKA